MVLAAGHPMNLSVRKNVDARSFGMVVEVENQPLGRTAIPRQRRNETPSASLSYTKRGGIPRKSGAIIHAAPPPPFVGAIRCKLRRSLLHYSGSGPDQARNCATFAVVVDNNRNRFVVSTIIGPAIMSREGLFE